MNEHDEPNPDFVNHCDFQYAFRPTIHRMVQELQRCDQGDSDEPVEGIELSIRLARVIVDASFSAVDDMPFEKFRLWLAPIIEQLEAGPFAPLPPHWELDDLLHFGRDGYVGSDVLRCVTTRDRDQ